jgi:hypothetical protein
LLLSLLLTDQLKVKAIYDTADINGLVSFINATIREMKQKVELVAWVVAFLLLLVAQTTMAADWNGNCRCVRACVAGKRLARLMIDLPAQKQWKSQRQTGANLLITLHCCRPIFPFN